MLTFTTGLATFDAGPSAVGDGHGDVPRHDRLRAIPTYWYRVFANGEVVGDVTMAGFPTMSADSVSNTLAVRSAPSRQRLVPAASDST